MAFFNSKNKFHYKFWCLILGMAILTACKKESIYTNLPLKGPSQIFYALSDNSLYKMNATDVKSLPTKITITGLPGIEKILSIDFRPATGSLYGVSDASKIYIIDETGVARPISSTPFNPSLNINTNTTVSLDFNATIDKIRVVTSDGQNLRISPETGAVVSVDNAINGVSGAAISGIAHTNSTAGAATTVLYDIDTKTKKLYKQEPANSGTLVEVGNLDLDLGINVSLDISPDNKNALAIGKAGDSTKLYTIDLVKGKATLSGRFPINTPIQSLAMPVVASAYAVDNANNFLIFNPLTGIDIISKAITGLQTGETVLAMDMRPLNGALYALGSTNRLYTIDLSSGVFTPVGTGPISPVLAGSIGFDFNPMKDRIQAVSSTRQNIEINPADGSTTVGPSITLGTATIGAAAFSNNFRGATTTTLFVIDYTTDKLYAQDPSTGVLTAIGDLKVDASSNCSFDITSSQSDNFPYAMLNVNDVMGLYQLNLNTGEAKLAATISKPITAFTLGLRFP